LSEKKENKMKRHNDENPTAPSTKKYKSRWDVGPNDVENEVLCLGVYPKSDIERKKIQPNSDIEKKRIQPKSDIERKITEPKTDIEKKKIQPKNDAQQKYKDHCGQDHCGQVNILLFFPNAMLTRNTTLLYLIFLFCCI
jgi:hypothetical protein